MASVCHWCFVNGDLGSLFCSVITTSVMRPCKQKDCQCESDARRDKDPGLKPATLYRGSFIEAGAGAPQKRKRRGRPCGVGNARPPGGTERIVPFRFRTAKRANAQAQPPLPPW